MTTTKHHSNREYTDFSVCDALMHSRVRIGRGRGEGEREIEPPDTLTPYSGLYLEGVTGVGPPLLRKVYTKIYRSIFFQNDHDS